MEHVIIFLVIHSTTYEHLSDASTELNLSSITARWKNKKNNYLDEVFVVTTHGSAIGVDATVCHVSFITSDSCSCWTEIRSVTGVGMSILDKSFPTRRVQEWRIHPDTLLACTEK
jgi:hypothetical protein